jgi:membrane protein implicated in regulation of membrane protease activity
VNNPSTFALIRDAFQLFEAKTDIFIPHGLQIGAFFIVVVVIIYVSWRAYIWLSSAGARDKEMIVIFLACLTYCLILPRFMNYCYILLIVPAYFIIKRISYPKGYILFFIIIILSIPTAVHLPGLSMIFQYMWEYSLLIIAFVLWGLYIYKIYGMPKKPSIPLE